MKKTKLLILSFAKDYWDGIIMSRHHIMQGLSERHKVLFISPQFNLIDVIQNLLPQKQLPESGYQNISKNLTTLVPPKIYPKIYFSSFLDNISTWLFTLYIKYSFIKKTKYDKIVLYIWNPLFANMIGKFNEDIVCYHVHDQYKGYATTVSSEAQVIEQREDYILGHADIVFANGEMLAKEKNVFNNTFNLPSGVNFCLYRNEYNRNSEEPIELANIPHPRIGYIGRITRKVDLHLLLELTKTKRNYSFIIIGPVRNDITVTQILEQLKRQRNFFYIQEKTAEELPLYIKFLDVCIMIYILNEHTKYGYPLKLHEYLSMGKPVVAAPLPCFKEFEDVVSVAFSAEEWLAAIDKSLIEQNYPSLVNKRIKIASQNSWQQRVQTIEDIILRNISNANPL